MRFSVEKALNYTVALARALSAVKNKGVIHRDVKPDNIWVINTPQGETVKIGDFGLAKVSKSSIAMTAQNFVMGTPEYMAPEQWRDAAKADWRADQYALGAILYEMVAGETPYGYMQAEDNAFAYGNAVTQNPLPDIRTKVVVPDALAGVLAKMLAKNPNDRFKSWEACIDALSSINTGGIGDDATAIASFTPGGQVKRKL